MSAAETTVPLLRIGTLSQKTNYIISYIILVIVNCSPELKVTQLGRYPDVQYRCYL